MNKNTILENLPIKNVQEILSLGYLSLLFFGLIRETITYGILGINVMHYSSVLDILLSPVIILAGNKFLLTSVILIPLLFYWGTSWFEKFHNRYKEKKWYQKIFDAPQLDKEYAKGDFSIKFVMAMTFGLLLGVFLGGGVLDGYKLKDELEKGAPSMTHILTFVDKEAIPVKIIGQNSQYVFYVIGKKKEIAISPIQGNIKRIEQLNKMEEE